MNAKTCLLAAALIGSSGLAGGGGNFQAVAAGRAGKTHVVFSEVGSAEYGTQKLKIAVYVKQGGRLLWQRQVNGHLYAASSGTQSFSGWGMVDAVLWVAHSWGGENWTVDNSGYRLSDGEPLWNNVDVGYPLADGEGEILFRRRQSQLARPDLRQIELVINNLSTGAEKRLNLQLPGRAGCGDPNAYSYEDADYLRRWADARFLYARQKDACGVFVARFDWHGSARQQPIFLPRR